MGLLFIWVMTWGRKWRLGTSMKAGWMLSTPASENKTHHDASLFTSSWHPCMFGELEISGCRVKTLCRNWKPSHMAFFFFFPQNQPSLCAPDPRLVGPWMLAMGVCQSLGGSDWRGRSRVSMPQLPLNISHARCSEGHGPTLCSHPVM